jgi:hypothetical protein
MAKNIFEYVDGSLCTFKCKYLYMDKLFNGRLEAKKNKTRLVDTVNIYINFESLYNTIRNKNVEKHLEVMDKKDSKLLYRQIISGFINVAAHYRKYFNRHKVKTNIVFYYNEIGEDPEEYNNTPLYEEYREHFFNSLHSLDRFNVNNMILDAIPFMHIITEYIEDVYFVGTRHVESSLIPFIFMMEGYLPCNMNMIISKDVYDLQYCNYNCLVISRYANEPVLLTKRNVMKFLCYKNNMDVERMTSFMHPKLITFILACIGDKKRSIYPIHRMGFKTVYRQLMNLYDAGYIFDDDPDTMKINSLMHVLNKNESKLVNAESLASIIVSQYQVTDFESQFRVVNDTQKKLLTDQIVNKTDVGALMDINSRYFEDFPLMLMELNQYNKNRDLDY